MRRPLRPLLTIAVGFVIPLIAVPAALHAQRSVPPAIDKGSKVIGGGASISRSTLEVDNAPSSQKQTVTSININPSLLVFVAPRFAVGGEVAFGYDTSDEASATNWGIGPAARAYLGGSERTLPYVGASVRLDRTTIDPDVGDSRSANGWAAEGTAGITWLLSRQVGIMGEGYVTRRNVSFDGVSGQADYDQTLTSFGVRFGVSAFLPRGR